MPRDPYKGPTPTQPKQRAATDLKPRLREDEPTLVRCPLCAGGCMVTPEVAAMFDDMVKARESRK